MMPKTHINTRQDGRSPQMLVRGAGGAASTVAASMSAGLAWPPVTMAEPSAAAGVAAPPCIMLDIRDACGMDRGFSDAAARAGHERTEMAVESAGLRWGDGGEGSRSQPSQTDTPQHTYRRWGDDLPDQTRATVQAPSRLLRSATPTRSAPSVQRARSVPLQPSPAVGHVKSVPAGELSQQVSASKGYVPE